MTTTYLPSTPPRDGDLIQLGATYGGGAFSSGFSSGFEVGTGTAIASAAANGRPAISGPIRVLEEAARYIACCCQPSLGGTTRAWSTTASGTMRLRIGSHPLGDTVEVRILCVASVAGNTLYVTSDSAAATSRTYNIPNSGSTTPKSATLITIPIQVYPAATPAAPSIEDISIVVTRTAGTVIIYQATIEPVPYAPTTTLSI